MSIATAWRVPHGTVGKPYECHPGAVTDAFLEGDPAEIRRGKPRVLIPTDDIALSLLSGARSRYEGLAVLPFPDAEIVQLAHDKGALMSLADEKGIPAPRTVVVREPADVERAIRSVGFPAVVKARVSRLVVGGQWRSAPGLTTYITARARAGVPSRGETVRSRWFRSMSRATGGASSP
jgi:predicted ATP-grasp superfamily ATP-dependent carboligase